MPDVLALAQIESLYPAQWVLVGDPEANGCQELLSGRVLCHSADRNEVCRRLFALNPPRFVLLFTGAKPPGGEFALLDAASAPPEVAAA